jgi:hypothetical protein
VAVTSYGARTAPTYQHMSLCCRVSYCQPGGMDVCCNLGIPPQFRKEFIASVNQQLRLVVLGEN